MNRASLVASTLALVLASACGERPLEPREPTPGVPHFTVATFNILDERSNDERTIAAVGNTGAQIVALQEVTSEWARVLHERFSKRYPYMLFAPSGSAGIGFISTFPLQDLKFMPGPNGWHPAWHVRAQTPAGWLQILNVHLRAPEGKGVANLQSMAALGRDHRTTIQLFGAQVQLDLPTIVVGDFNEETDGEAVRFLEARGFHNALPLYRPGQFTSRHRSVGGQFTHTIDHILFDRSVQPLNAWVADGGNSDHLPVIAHFEASYAW